MTGSTIKHHLPTVEGFNESLAAGDSRPSQTLSGPKLRDRRTEERIANQSGQTRRRKKGGESEKRGGEGLI